MARIKLKVKARKGIIRLKSLIVHPMETGFRKRKGKLIPANHIVKLEITNNGRVVVSADIGGSISKNPYFQFHFSGKKDDLISLNYLDNMGKTGSMSTTSR